MFASACDLAGQFTFPLIISLRFFDGTTRCSLGSFIRINKEGWVITVAHVFELLLEQKIHNAELRQYNEERSKIEADPNLDAKQKRKRVNRLHKNNAWITVSSVWWGGDGVASSNLTVFPELDLAIAKLSPSDANTFPVFKNPVGIRPGTSLCKLGFPFYEIKATFNEGSGKFVLPPETFPIPRFPIEGIFTRNILCGRTNDKKYDIKFIETSSPGLRGQSGGPVFDIGGNVWGIQSQTRHFPLGFSPRVKKNGREVEENQFLNAGWAVHPDVILSVYVILESNLK